MYSSLRHTKLADSWRKKQFHLPRHLLLEGRILKGDWRACYLLLVLVAAVGVLVLGLLADHFGHCCEVLARLVRPLHGSLVVVKHLPFILNCY